MNGLTVNIFIFILHLYLLVNVITEDIIELGQSSCRYSGSHDPNNAACYADALELSKLPANECTSYVYDGISSTDDSKIIPTYSQDDLTNIKSLTNFSSKVFLSYGLNLNVWKSDKFNDCIEIEAQNLKEFLDEYPAAGLILTGIETLYESYCKADEGSKWCADNENTFYEKGVFARQYAAGWVGRDIDLVDRGVSCGCNGDQFISFHMILDAYNNKTMRTCDFQKG
uniref:Uncharacterized protein n=1 Tax=Schizaphis graminum TaxID=13262 RepID=A0A2S2NJJ4_SCHGA